jgi:hypothetical protein
MNELTVAGRSLVVLDSEPNLIDTSLDIQLIEVGREIDDVETKLEGLETMIGRSLNQLCFRFPEISIEFRQRYNKFLELKGEDPIASHIDPFSRSNAEGNNEEIEAQKAEKEAEEAARRELESADDAKLSPKQRREKLALRMRREKCRKFYMRISRRTHPDKVKDSELNDIFIKAKKAYDELNLDELREMFKDLEGYLKLRGSARGNFRQYRFRKLEVSKMYLEDLKESLKNKKETLAYKCYEAAKTGDTTKMRFAYEEYVESQLELIERAVEELRAQARRRRTLHVEPEDFKMPAHLKAQLMEGLFSND